MRRFSCVIARSGTLSRPGSRRFGVHPLLCILDKTGGALAGILGPDPAGSNTAADHIEVLDLASVQIADVCGRGESNPVRTATTGSSTGSSRTQGPTRPQDVEIRLSVGAPIDELVRDAIKKRRRRPRGNSPQADG